MSSNIRSTSNPLVLTTLDGEPRVYDLDLATRLGFEHPLNIRNLIKRNMDKLLKFGILSTVERIHQGAGRPTFAYYPNQKQSLWLCMKSETSNAFDVQADIVRVYDAYLNGELKPATTETAISVQHRLFYACARIGRAIDLARDAGVKQAMIWELQELHSLMGIRMPPIHMFGKPADQMPLEI